MCPCFFLSFLRARNLLCTHIHTHALSLSFTHTQVALIHSASHLDKKTIWQSMGNLNEAIDSDCEDSLDGDVCMCWRLCMFLCGRMC